MCEQKLSNLNLANSNLPQEKDLHFMEQYWPTIYFTISGNVYDDMTQDVVTAMTEKALKSGINFIDTAPWYGQGLSEKRLGVALKNIPRDKYFIATKVSETHKTANRGKLFYTIPLTSTCQFTLFQNTKNIEFFKYFSN